MMRIHKIENTQEHYAQEVALCARCIMTCKVDLSQSQRCLDRCDNGGTEHWEKCVAVHGKELQANEERLERLKTRFREMKVRKDWQEREEIEECEYRN